MEHCKEEVGRGTPTSSLIHTVPQHTTIHLSHWPQVALTPKSSLLCLPRPHPSGPTKPTTQTPKGPAFLPSSQVSCSTKSTRPPSLPWRGSSKVWLSSCYSSTSCEAGIWTVMGGMEAVAGQARRKEQQRIQVGARRGE